jgi:hypothetical protein
MVNARVHRHHAARSPFERRTGRSRTVRTVGALLASIVLHLLFTAGAMAANEPVTGIDIIIRSKADGRILIETITDGRGTIVVKEMRPGVYSVEAGGKLPLALLKRSGSWGIALIPIAAKTAKPQSHRAKPTAKGMQVDVVVPEGTTISYTVIVTN